MRPFLLTSAARLDMINIGRFTGERWGKQQRNTYLKQLDTTFKLLAQQPEIGKDASAIKPGYRKFVQGSHIIFYRTGTDSKILVIRVRFTKAWTSIVIYKSITSEFRGAARLYRATSPGTKG